jgi:peptidoglycan/LPS O-acetylase OafA/YrhL
VAIAVAVGVLFFGVGALDGVFRDAVPKAALDIGYGLCAAALIVALVQAEQQRPGRFRQPFVAILGDASYALYLIHFPLIAVLCKLAVGVGLHGVFGMAVSFVGIFVACIAVSMLFHLWIEKPILKALSSKARTATPSLQSTR